MQYMVNNHFAVIILGPSHVPQVLKSTYMCVIFDFQRCVCVCADKLIMCMLFIRYMSQAKHAEARELMYNGALLFFSYNQVTTPL